MVGQLDLAQADQQKGRWRQRADSLAAERRPAVAVGCRGNPGSRACHPRRHLSNEQEAALVSTALFGAVDYQRLRAYTESKLIFVTKGEHGVLVVGENSETLIPGRPIDKAVDICGAGDSFSAGAAVTG